MTPAKPVTPDWANTHQRACRAFGGQTPRPADERRVADAYAANPELVDTTIDEVAAALAAGRVRWGWSTLAARLARAADTPSVERELARVWPMVERWMAHAGAHFDRWDEVRDELAGRPSRMLGRWAADGDVLGRVRAMWERCRPAGVAVEEAAVGRADAWRRAHGSLAPERVERPVTRRGPPGG